MRLRAHRLNHDPSVHAKSPRHWRDLCSPGACTVHNETLPPTRRSVHFFHTVKCIDSFTQTTVRPFISISLQLRALSKASGPPHALRTFTCFFILPLFFLLHALPIQAQEPSIAAEIRERAEDFGYLIIVDIVNNRYTGMQDLMIRPAQRKSYDTGELIHAVCAAAAQVTAQSPAYQTHIDVAMIDVNGELWAISTESCRRAFHMSTEPAQRVFLGRSLQRLR
jgi:hypothetical protein